MTDGYERHAVYWVPPASDPLSEFGLSWTGWCPDAGEKRTRMRSPAEGLDLVPLTRRTCLEGFHGVLAAPFRLTQSRQIWSLQRALALLADEVKEVTVHALGIAVVDGRVSLVPRARSTALDRLAERVRNVTRPFVRNEQEPRSETDAADVEFAKQHRIEVRPAESFHMPLTDRLSFRTACQVARRLRPLLGEMLDRPHTIGDFSLVGDPGEGRRSRVEEHFPLSDQVGASFSEAFACRGPRVYAPLGPLDRMTEPAA